MRKFMSLGSNCSVASTIKDLNIREPGPLDWTNHFPIIELFKNASIADIITNNYLYYIHEDIMGNSNQLTKVVNRFRKMQSLKDIEFVYAAETDFECSEESIMNLLKITNGRPLHVIFSSTAITSIPEYNLEDVNFYLDEDYIFDGTLMTEEKHNLLRKNWFIKNILKGEV